MKSIDPRVKPFEGVWFLDKGPKLSSRWVKVSFDSVTGYYFIQVGNKNIKGKYVERTPSTYKQAGSALAYIQEVTSGLTLRPDLADIPVNAMPDFLAPRAQPLQPLPEVVITELEVVEGKNVKIGRHVLPVLEVDAHTAEHIPEIIPHYYFSEQADDVILDLLEKRTLLLVGHTGSGKTSLPQQIAARINQPVIRVNMNGQTTIGDFVGNLTVKGQETVWCDGVLPWAMKTGAWLIIDELDCADPSILALLNPVLERKGVLTLKENGREVIKPHENFRIIATANTAGCMAGFRNIYQGTHLMNEAFLDRFRMYLIPYMPPEQEQKVLLQTVKGLTKPMAEIIVRLATHVREAFTNEEVSTTFSTRRVIDLGEMAVRHGNLKKSAQSIIYSKVSTEDSNVINQILTRLVP